MSRKSARKAAHIEATHSGAGKTVKLKEAVPERIREEPNPPAPKWQIAAIAVVVLVAALLNANLLRNGFIFFDDPELVVDNYAIHELTVTNLTHFFTTPTQMTYLPMGLVTYAVDYKLGQLDPSVYHRSNVFYHLLTVVVVYALFRLLTKNFYAAIFIAGLFAIHPVNVDTIAWVATRNNILATLFYLGSLLLYTLYLEHKLKPQYLIASVLVFVLAAASKSSAVVLPLILLLWDFYYGRKWDRRVLLEKVPFAVVSVIFGLITLKVRTDVVPPGDYTELDRVLMFGYSLVDYVVRLLFPFRLSMAYTYPAKDGNFLPFTFWLAPFALYLIYWGLQKLKVSRRTLILGLSFFALNILLSQSTMLIDNFRASRYAYLSYVGLYLILADVSEQIRTATSGWRMQARPVWMGALAVFAIGFAYLTYQRNFVWKDTITLFGDVIDKQPGMPWVYNSRGIAKYKANDLDGALADFNQALALDPRFPLSLYYRGVISEIRHDYDAALADLDATIGLVPDFANAYNDRGKVRNERRDYAGAAADLTRAISLNTYFAEAYVNRSLARRGLNDVAGACEDQKKALSLGLQPESQNVIPCS
jgi:protein O-mannosyl-transferase